MRDNSQSDDTTTALTPAAEQGLAERVRARYTKTGKLRFVSAIDVGRLWERALRRADLPIAYSEGFSPHPKVSFPDALPLGYASTGEYVELTFAGPVPVADAVRRLNAALPDGLQVVAAAGLEPGAPKLSKWLRASVWELCYPPGLDDVLAGAVRTVRDAEVLPVARERKGEAAEVDLRPALHAISTCPNGVVRAVLHHVEPSVRPSEVHLALAAASGAPLSEPVLVTRLGQGAPSPGGLTEALSDRRVPVTAAPGAPPSQLGERPA